MAFDDKRLYRCLSAECSRESKLLATDETRR